MGLDAVVFCNCAEKGRLKKPHPYPNLLYIAPNGSPEIRSKNERQMEQHDGWMRDACKHEGMMLDGDHLGSIGGIQFLRDILRRAVTAPARTFPVLWKKVIYSGSHTGDYLTAAKVKKLAIELDRLSRVDFARLEIDPDNRRYIGEFRGILRRLTKAALKIGKPIAF
jgi:hypothetical protein